MLAVLNDYAQLVNIAIFIAIIGFIFQVSREKRSAEKEQTNVYKALLVGHLARIQPFCEIRS